MEERLQELRAEYEKGLQQIARLDNQRSEVQRTLLRISGAIQVLEEIIARQADPEEVAVRPLASGVR